MGINMDTSEKYIEMCKQAKEIQDSWKTHCGDTVTCDNPKDGRIVIVITGQKDLDRDCEFLDVIFPHSYGQNRDYKRKDLMVYLPRQDQLQEMIGDFSTCLQIMIDFPPGIYMADSGEQLWLSKLMEIKYRKLWDEGKSEWVDI